MVLGSRSISQRSGRAAILRRRVKQHSMRELDSTDHKPYFENAEAVLLVQLRHLRGALLCGWT